MIMTMTMTMIMIVVMIMINTLFILQKINQLTLNIKTAGINLCAVEKIFQISVILKTEKEDLVTTIKTIN